MRNELSETSLALNTMVNDDEELPDPLIEGTATRYIDGCLKTLKEDKSLKQVKHPWTKTEIDVATRRRQQLRAHLAHNKGPSLEEKLDALKNVGNKVTDLKGVHTNIRKTSSLLYSALAEAPKTKKWYTPITRRPSTVPPPSRPMQALKKLQHAIVEDFDAYKRLPPRELGPGSYGVGLAPAILVKEPEKPSYCFITSSARSPSELQSSHLDGMRPRFTSKQLPSSSTANNAANEQKQRDMWLHGHGVPRTYVDRQKKISRIVEMHSPVRLDRMRLPLKRSMSIVDRMHRGKHAYTRRKKKSSRNKLKKASSLGSLSITGTSAGRSLWADDGDYWAQATASGANSGRASTTTFNALQHARSSPSLLNKPIRARQIRGNTAPNLMGRAYIGGRSGFA